MSNFCSPPGHENDSSGRMHFHGKQKWKNRFPDFELLTSSSERVKPYSTEEIRLLKEMKQEGATIQEIADVLQRSYWSVVYKWREIKDKYGVHEKRDPR